MQSHTSLIINQKHYCKLHPRMQVSTICRSPFCGYYRQLCETCILPEDNHVEKSHIKFDKALSYVQNRLRQIQKSMLILKKQKQQKLKSNRIALPYEITQKVSHIRDIINEKISLFQKTLEERYERQVNLKLQSLEDTIKKSLDFLKKQINELENQKYDNFDLKKFFINFQYWQHERKYYKSYMQEILEKQVRNFKQGFDDDSIMKLIVNFQIHLLSIFSQNKQNSVNQTFQRPHIFFQEKKQLKKYQIMQRHDNLHFTVRPQFIQKPYPKENYKWVGPPQSIYSSELDCYYIFGQGYKPSNTIIKYEDGNQNGNKKLSLVAEMLVKRSYFSVCLINGQIFIIGGYNQKQGCLSKCQKLVLNQKTKIYLVSSLQQRSACHSVCNYKSKYILKFGGTSIKLNQTEKYRSQGEIRQLYPQIYEIDRQQWRTIRYNVHNSQQRLQFGLWPLIVVSYEGDPNKIVIFGNKALDRKYENFGKINKKNENKKNKFVIKCHLTRNDIELKIIQDCYNLNRKYLMLPQTYHSIQKINKSQILVKDVTKSQNFIQLIDIQNCN